MASYGGYDIKRSHSPGALSSVYEAISNDGIAGRYALKIFHPPPSTKARRLYAIEGFLLVAERQQRAAKAGQAALEVLEWGRCEEGAYMVMPWREGSFEALVESLSPRGDMLRVLATRLLDALGEWEGTYGIPHGKLKPTNIFAEGDGPLATRALRLSDSWFMPGMKADELRRRDLALVGEMLVRVVRRRAAGGWPIEDAPEWQALGRAGPAWREFCNFLLDPNPPAGEHTLEKARERLQKIPRDVRPGRTAALGMAALFALAALGLLGFARFGGREALPNSFLPLAEWIGNPNALRTEVSPEWADLARAYNTWIGDVQRNTERWDGTAALWTPDDPLRKALADFRTAAKDLDPRVLVPEAAGNSLGVLADTPPAPVRTQLLRELVNRRVQDAWGKVNVFALQFGKWPGWTQVSKTADQLAARGRPRVAAALRQRLPPTPAPGERPEVTTANRLRGFNELSQDQYGALVLLPRWRDFETVATELGASGDRVQAALPKLALAPVPDTSSLGDFADALGAPVAELHRRRQQFLAPEVSRDRFVHEAPLLAEKGEVTADDLPKWEQQLALYSRIPATDDPRAGQDWDDQVRRMTASETELEAGTTSDGAAKTISRADLDRELTALKTSIAALRAKDVLRVDREATLADVTRLRATLVGLEQRLEATLSMLRPELWLDTVSKKTWHFASTQERWDAWRQHDIAGLTSAGLTQDRARFTQLRQIERNVQSWLEDFEGKAGLGGLEVPALPGADAESIAGLQGLENRQRTQLAKSILDASPWPDNRPPNTWAVAAAQPRVATLLDGYRRWLAQLPDFARDLDRLNALLAGGFGWTEGVAEALQRLSARTGFDAMEGRAGGWVKDAQRLQQIAGSNDRVALFAASKEDGLSVPLTAWRRMGLVPGWPVNAADLDVERTMDVNLRAKFGTAAISAERRNALVEELNTEIRLRWMRAARQAAGNETAMTGAFQRMGRFGLTENDLDGPMRFNFKLWQIKSADWNEGDLGRLRQRRDNFVNAVKGIAEIHAHPEITALIGALSKLGLRDDEAASSAVTPRRVGWTEDYVEGGQRVVVSWPGGRQRVELEFQLVLPTDGTPPFYLSRREIAVGEFIDQVNERPEGKAVMDAMPPWVRHERGSAEPFTVLMPWRPRPDGHSLEMSSSWIYHPAPEITPSVLDAIGVEIPSPTTPMQRVPPDAARIFAEQLVGARLPKPEEWTALMRLVGETKEGNFRDQRFERLWSFLNNYRVAGQTVSWRPTQGAYLPLQPAQDAARLRRLPIVDNGSIKPDAGSFGLFPIGVDRGPEVNGFINLLGNVWVYLYDAAQQQYYVAGGSVLSPPVLDPTKPQLVEGIPLIGSSRGRKITEGFSDVGIRPAFDAPLGLRERFEMLRLVRAQQFLTL